MSKSKQDKIAGIEGKIAQLENQRKQLIQKQKADERKARTKRLIERGVILESFIPEADTLTNEQIKIFLEKTIKSDYATKMLAGLKSSTESSEPNPKPSTAEKGTNKPVEATEQISIPASTKPTGATTATADFTSTKSNATPPQNGAPTQRNANNPTNRRNNPPQDKLGGGEGRG